MQVQITNANGNTQYKRNMSMLVIDPIYK